MNIVFVLLSLRSCSSVNSSHLIFYLLSSFHAVFVLEITNNDEKEEESEPENWDNEDGDDDDDIASFETGIRKQKNNFVNTHVSTNNESDFDEEDDNDEVQRMSPKRKTNNNSSPKKVKARWNEQPMEKKSTAAPSWAKISEDRLQEIKQMIRKNKKEIGSDTSCSEDDAGDDVNEQDKYKELMENEKLGGER